MDRYKTGMLVESKAGHDTGQIYMIIKAEDAYVYLADGKIRTLDKLKKKKKIHVQPICRDNDISAIDDTAIKRILKEFKREKEKTGGSNHVKS